MAKKAANRRFNGNWATIPPVRKEHSRFMEAALRSKETPVAPRPIGTCSRCRRKFTDVTVDALRRQLLAHWEKTHRVGTPQPVTPPLAHNGDYPVADNKDEDSE